MLRDGDIIGFKVEDKSCCVCVFNRVTLDFISAVVLNIYIYPLSL